MKKQILTIAILFLLPFGKVGVGLLFSQSISSEDQQKINIIQGWVQEQLKQGKTPTPEQMDSINKAVKVVNDNQVNGESGKQDATQLPNDPTTSITKITKQCLMGGSLTVPENKIWKVKRVFVTEGIGGGYNILVSSEKYKEEYKSGEKIFAPAWSAESSLLTEDASTVSYIFEIEEKEVSGKLPAVLDLNKIEKQ